MGLICLTNERNDVLRCLHLSGVDYERHDSGSTDVSIMAGISHMLSALFSILFSIVTMQCMWKSDFRQRASAAVLM